MLAMGGPGCLLLWVPAALGNFWHLWFMVETLLLGLGRCWLLMQCCWLGAWGTSLMGARMPATNINLTPTSCFLTCFRDIALLDSNGENGNG
jgi:hypothetical protein